MFKLHSPASSRHIVPVFNKREDHIFGTFLAIPDYRLQPSSEPIINFHERAAGSPIAVREWFYPGRTYGHEFVYPKTKAVALAQANNTPVPSMPTELTPDTTMPDIKTNGPEIAAFEVAILMAEKLTGEVLRKPSQSTTLPSPLPGFPILCLLPRRRYRW
jgi:hypothetical protein